MGATHFMLEDTDLKAEDEQIMLINLSIPDLVMEGFDSFFCSEHAAFTWQNKSSYLLDP